MKKILLVGILLLLLFPYNVYAIDIESKSAIVVNRNNGDILYEKNIDEKLPIASLTKIMTTLVSLENIKSLDDKVIVNKEDIKDLDGYSILDLSENMEISYEELLYSCLIHSAADSSMVLSNNVFNTYDEFINEMNELAVKLEMNNTKLTNPVGFDNDNYSTVNDLYKLLDYALDNESFRNIFETKTYKMKSLNKTIKNDINNYIKYNIENFNNINFDGYKGGYTKKSGLCLSGNMEIDDNELIIITLGAMGDIDSKLHLIDGVNILNNIKNNYSNRVILEKDKLVDNIIYKENNKEYNYEIKNNKTIKYFMNNNINLNYLKIYYEGKTIISNEDKKIGSIRVEYEDKILSSTDVYFNKKNIVKNKVDYKNIFIFFVICLVGLFIFRNKK